VKFEDIESMLATGDILLFHGSSEESLRIEDESQSYFSHAAMVIRRDATKPALLWQTGPGPIAVDAMTHASHGGAQLSRVRDALIAETLPSYGDTAYIRQMQFARTPEFEIATQWAISGLDGTPFSTLQDIQKDFEEGQRHIVVSDTTFFCSGLVAHTLMMIGLLPFDPPPNAYPPGWFSPEYGNLPFLRGASLGPLLQLVPPVAPAATGRVHRRRPPSQRRI
jgi:hypothetical protein